MKFFLVILPGLLLFDSLQGSTVPPGRLTRALNTTLRTNFSGIYQRKNPCSGTEVETSSYKASHELHHHTKDDGWCDYTHKCSAIIRNFLHTIGNLMKFNHDPTGSFNFYLNTSISQKQRLTGDPKSCESLPTIVIEATDCKIPINPCCQISRGENVKYKNAEDREFRTDQFPDEGIILPPPDFSAPEDCKSQEVVPISDTMVSPQSATHYPGRDWFKAEESSREDDKHSFSTGFSSSAQEDFSPAVLYELSRDTKSAYEPKPKIFKTSLKLTPQADPENGTIKPRIHYMATNLMANPSESAPQSEMESPFLQPGRPGPLMPVSFPEGPNHPTTSPSPSSEYPSQVPQSSVASSFQPYANQNEPVQLSVTGQPEPQFSLSSSQTENLAETTAAPHVEPFTIPADLLPLPARLSNDPSGPFTLEDQNAISRINDPQFSFDPLRSQPSTTMNYGPDIPTVQSTPPAPQFFDIPSRPTRPNSRSDLIVSSADQAQPNLLQLPRQRPQEDLPSQVSRPAVDFPEQSPNVNGEALNYPTTLSRPPTVGDPSIKPKPQTFTPNFENQIIPPVPRDAQFNAPQISPPYQQFPGQLPHDNLPPSIILPPRDSFRTYEDTTLTTPLPPLQPRSKEVPNSSGLIPGESQEKGNDRSIPLASQPSVAPYLASFPANGLPYSDSLITSSPGLDGRVEPAGSYLGQQPTSDGHSTKRFHSSSVTTGIEETITLDQKQTTPGFVLDTTAEQLPGSTSPSPSGPDLSSSKASQQLTSVLPNYPQPQLPGPGPFTAEGDSRPLVNPKQLISEDSNNFSTADSQITDATLNPNNDQVLAVTKTSQTVPVPFRQESQLPEPEFDLPSDGSMTTPMPFAPEGKPSSASRSTAVAIYPEARPTMEPPTRQYPPGEYNFQIPSQQLYSTPQPVLAGEPPVGYSDHPGNIAPPASDSLVRSDYLTTAIPQSLIDNINGITSIPDNSLAYGTASINQFTDSPQQKPLLISPENSPPATGLNGVRAGPQITEGVSAYLPPTVTPPPEVYAPRQEQQSLASTSSRLLQKQLPPSEQFSTDQVSRLSTEITKSPEAVLSQEQFGNGQNQGRNPLDIYSVTTIDTERNFQTPFQSATPVYGTQSPINTDSKQIFEPQFENKYGQRIPNNPLDSLELSDGKPTTDSSTSLQALSSDLFPENSGPSDQYPPAFPSPNTFPAYVDATTTNFPPAAERPNQEFALNRPSAFVSSLPAGKLSSEITPGSPNLQQSSQNSEQFSSFSSQQPSPDLPVDTSKPQVPAAPLARLPLSPAPKPQYQNENFDRAPPVNSITTTSTIKDLSSDSLPGDAYAFPLPQDAGTIPSNESPRQHTLPLTFQTGENQFFTPSTPQPTLPVLTFDKSIQTTPQQPSDFVLPSSIVSQSRSSDLVFKAPLEAPELSIDQPIVFETNTVQPPTSLQVGPAFETIPPPSQPGKTGLQDAEKETTPQSQPQVFDGTSFNPQSVDSAADLQETAVFDRREESRLNDFGQNNNLPVAPDSSSLPQRSAYQTTIINAVNSNQFATGSTEAPFLEPLQTLPESTPAEEITTIQQHSFPSPDSHQFPNHAARSSDESSSSFAPLVSQQISTPNIQTQASADRSSAAFQQEAQSLDLTTNNLLPSTTPAPEMALTYPDRPTSYDSRENVHSLVSDSVESLSSRQESQREIGFAHYSPIPPSALNAESQTLSPVNSSFHERDQHLSETTSVVNLQHRPYGPYGLPPGPLFSEPTANSYNGNLPMPPRALLPNGYPAPNHMRPPLPDSGFRPPFYGQLPPPSPPLNSSQKAEPTVPQVTESEIISQSPGPQTKPRLGQPGVSFNPEGQLDPGDIPPAYLQNPPNPNGPMPPFTPNYNAFQPQDRYRYFGPPPLPPNYDPRLRLNHLQNFPNRISPTTHQQNFPAYPTAIPLRDQRPVSPPVNQIINDRQTVSPRENYPLIRPNFSVQPGKQMGLQNEGQTFRQQTEDRSPVDSHSGLPIRPETASHPFDQPPTSPAIRPPPTQGNDHPNPLLQALQSQLVVPTQEHPQQQTSFPERFNHSEQLSSDTKNGSQIDDTPASPTYPGRWNPLPAINFVKLQQNTAIDSLRGVPNGPQPDPHALVPDQTTPSNEPGKFGTPTRDRGDGEGGTWNRKEETEEEGKQEHDKCGRRKRARMRPLIRVFSSALVRYPRHAVSKPTSSVHTEYEATYEQKGKHGNGSYSTVSGKQEVMHDNCHDNWNAFADKCATLIKDLVASLGNAVSSKPGDATNLQLRIRNTFKHFDSTDNCTCFAKNSLTSLFDNVTESTGQPVEVHEEGQNGNGNSGQGQSRTCEGESCKAEGNSGQKVLSSSQQRRGQPSFTLTNAEDVDPENADTSSEASTTNSRRGVQYPAVIVKDPSQRSRGSGTGVSESKQPSPTSGSSSNTKKILTPTAGTSQSASSPAKAPAEIVVPMSQSKGPIKTRPLKSTTSSRTSAPQQSSAQSASPVYRPAKNNGIVRSAIPVRSSSSASKSSPPEAAAMGSPSASNNAGSGSGQATAILSDAKTPLEVPVEPVEEVVPVNGEETPTEKNAASNQTPVTVPVVLTEPVNSAATKRQSDSSVSSAANDALGQIPSVGSESESLSGVLAEPETIPIKSEKGEDEDCDEEEGSDGSESDQTPIAKPLVSASGTEPQSSSSNDEGSPAESNDESVQTTVVSMTKPVDGAAAEPDIVSNMGSPAVNNGGSGQSEAEPEIISIKNEGENEEDCDEEKGSEGSEPVLTPVIPVAEPENIPVKTEGNKDEDCDDEKGREGSEGSESDVIPVVPAAEPGSGTASDQINDTAAEPVSVPVAEPETTAIKSEGDNEEDCDEEKGSEGSEPVLTPVVPVAEPVSGTEGDQISDTAAEPVSGIRDESVNVPVAKPETIAIKSEGDNEEDCDEKKGSEGSESVPVAEPETISIKSDGDKGEDRDEEGSKNSEQVLTPVVPVAEPGTIPVKSKGGEDEDCDEEKGSEGSEPVLTPVVPVAEPVSDTEGDQISDTAAEPVSGTKDESLSIPMAEPETTAIKSEGDNEENCDEENISESEQIPVVPPVISAAEPEVTSINDEGDSDDEGAAGNGSNQRQVKPVTSTFQDPSTVVSKGNTNFASNPKSSVVPAIPVSDSDDSEIPMITQAADSTNQEPLSVSDDPVPPEIASASDTDNVKPGLVVEKPPSHHSSQKNPSAKVPLINSNSNLPDSAGPVDSAGTVNPSPIYRSLPTAPSATPSSDSAVISNKPQQSTNKQEVSKPLAHEHDKMTQTGAGQSISSRKGIPVAPTAASQRFQGKGKKETGEKVFIVTPVPVYPEKVIVKPVEPTEEISKKDSSSKGYELTGVAHTKPAEGGGASGPAGNRQQENLPTTPIPVIPVVTKEHNGDAAGHSASGKPSLQQHPVFTNLGNKKSAGNQPKQITGEPVVLRPQSSPPKVVKVRPVQTAEDEDLTKPTTFQTTSTDPTPPQQSIQSPPLKNPVSLTRPTSVPQDSFETPHGAPVTSPRTSHDDDDDEEEEEDCCSCESCTEEEMTNPKQYKEMACKDLEEARKELKAIFDKIKKRLKCGKKAPQKIVAS